MEIMVSTSLIFLILSGVYGTAELVSRLFKKEAEQILNTFPLDPYLDSIGSLLARSDQVRPLRTDSGFIAIFVDLEKRRGRTVVHYVREGALYRHNEEFAWEGDPEVKQGELAFDKYRTLAQNRRKDLLRGYSRVTMEVRRKDTDAFLLVRYTSQEGVRGERWLPLGGDVRLYSMEPFLFQDSAE